LPTFGAIYIAKNSLDGDDVYKVGMTQRSTEERMRELTSETSNLGEYEAIGSVIVNDVSEAEKECHSRLRHYRIQANREFFKAPLKILISAIRVATEPYLVKDELPETEQASEEIHLDDLFQDEESKISHGKQKTDDSRLKAEEQLVLWHTNLLKIFGQLKDKLIDNSYVEVIINKSTIEPNWDSEIKSGAFKSIGGIWVGEIILKGKLTGQTMKIYEEDDHSPELDDGRYAQLMIFLGCGTQSLNEKIRDFRPIIILEASILYLRGTQRIFYDSNLIKAAHIKDHNIACEVIARMVAANIYEIPEINTIFPDDGRRDLQIKCEPMDPYEVKED